MSVLGGAWVGRPPIRCTVVAPVGICLLSKNLLFYLCVQSISLGNLCVLHLFTAFQLFTTFHCCSLSTALRLVAILYFPSPLPWPVDWAMDGGLGAGGVAPLVFPHPKGLSVLGPLL